VAVVSTVQSGLILGGLFYAETPWASALLLGVAPLAVVVDRLGPVRRWPAWAAGLVRAAAVLAVDAVAAAAI
jgi:hypothetical protein